MARCPVAIGLCLASLITTLATWYEYVPVASIDLHPRAFGDQPWRVITCTLAHARFPAHLIFNAYWLWRFGVHLEARIGSLRMLPLYLLLAAGSMGAQLLLSSWAIGMSGVIYGLFGLLWVLEQKDERFVGILGPGTAQMLVMWFFLCVFMTAADVMAVANVAHGAGALFGWLLGQAVTTQGARRALFRVALLVAVFVCALASPLLMPWSNVRAAAWAQRLNGESADAYVEGELEDALASVEGSLRLDPDVGMYWYNHGLVQWELGERATALLSFERAVQLSPEEELYQQALDSRR